MMNWGVKIVIGLSLFVGLIVTMVVICMRQTDLHLVSADYYEQEIGYQQTIDEQNNLLKLGVKPAVHYNLSVSAVEVDFSHLPSYPQISGNLNFFRPSDPSLDFTEAIALSPDGKQFIPGTRLQKGKWIVKMKWENGGVPYYMEQSLVIG